MYKNKITTDYRCKPSIVTKSLLIMKLTLLLFLWGMFQGIAGTKGQTITLKSDKVTYGQIFREIQRQTGYDVLLRTEGFNLEKHFQIDFYNTPLNDVLKWVKSSENVDYSLDDKTIIIRAKQVASSGGRFMNMHVIDVKGRVTDDSGKPLPNATVRVKGTNNVILTNDNGEFLMRGIADNSLLVITYLGYRDKEVRAKKDDFLQIRLSLLSQSLEEIAVVSTGYQTLKKSQLTGAYATIDRETYQQSVPVAGNIISNMEGRLAGLMLNVNQSRNLWGDRNNTSPFVIRGISTFQAIKKPLIVLNGYPTEIDIESINPYDIESVTILKDAASAAIYGVRASNGVVVINTRKGAQGKPKISFTTAFSTSPKANYDKLKLLRGRDYIDFERATSMNDIENNFMSKAYIDERNGTYTPVFSITDDLYNGRITEVQADKLFDELAAYDNTNDYKKLFLQNTFYQSYDLNVSGGGTNSTYFFGVNHQNNRLEEKFSGFNKTNINYRGTFEFSKRVSLDVQNLYSTIRTNSASVPSYMDFKPYQPFFNVDGSPAFSYYAPFNQKYYGFGMKQGTISAERNQLNMEMGLYDQMYYPYQEMFESRYNSNNQMYRGQGNLKINLLNGLDLDLGGIYEVGRNQGVSFATENAYETRIMLNYFAQRDPISGRPMFNVPQGGTNRTEDAKVSSYTLRSQLTYNKQLQEKHDISLLLGMEQRKNTLSNKLNTVFGYNNKMLTIKATDLTLLGNHNYSPGYVSEIVSGLYGYVVDQTTFDDFFKETYSDDRFLSYYANAAYTYKNKYTATGSLRIDQSNLFGEDPKFRYTPLWSAGVSWNIRNEDFMKDISWFDELKIRVAGGYNGNIKKGSGPFNLLTAGINNYLINPVIGYRISAPRNDELRWEKTFNFNTGLDFGLFEGRLSGALDYYVKRGTDIFAPIESDPTKGFSNLLTNNASIENRGIDLNISTVNIKRETFYWKTQLTGSFNKSKVLKVRNTFRGFFNFSRAGGAENIEGQPMNSILTLNYLGLNESGQPMVKDENGNPVILGWDPQVDVPLTAMNFSGVNDPKYVLGFNNQLGLGNFSLSALIMYYGGHMALISPPNIFDDRPVEGAQNYWKKPGDEALTNIPGFGGAYGTPEYIQVRDGYFRGQQFVRKMDFLALRNITLTYNMPDVTVRKLGLSNTKLIFQVQNPAKYVFSGNDVDPETLDFVGGRRGLPTVPFYTFSLTTSF